MMEWGWWVLLALPVVGMVTLAGCGLLDMAEQGGAVAVTSSHPGLGLCPVARRAAAPACRAYPFRSVPLGPFRIDEDSLPARYRRRAHGRDLPGGVKRCRTAWRPSRG